MTDYDERLEAVRRRIPEEWGQYIGCGEGWSKIIADLDEAIAAIDPNYTVHQVKEKFGGLRYYIESTLDYQSDDRRAIDSLIEEAEELSMRTCEVCGEPGTRDGHGSYWVKTLCVDCSQQAIERRSKAWGGE